MKYLQIYDHNGNLSKEFPVYVDGEDFSWAADKPEAVWLGTIRLVTEPATKPVEPTPEPKLPALEILARDVGIVVGEAEKERILGPETEVELDLSPEEVDKLAEEASAEWERQQEAEVELQAPLATITTGISEPAEVRCPVCNSENIADCPGGSNIEPIAGIDYICADCLYEFGKEMLAESEVKHEPEKRVYKSRRKPRAKSSDGAEGPEAVS